MTRFRWFAAILAALIVLLLAIVGCGGTHSRPTIAGHRCDPHNYVMQCAPVEKQHPVLHAGAPIFARGVDFAWGGPSCASLKANGWSFGASYLSYDFSKNFSHSQVGDYLAHGCKVVFVWETSSDRAGQGFGAGQSDAREALRQYRTYISQGRVVIYFAIDFDASGGQVDSYFRGVDSVLGAGQAGAYGGIRPLNYLFGAHLIDWGWQTYAWSGGAWNGSQLEQYLNDGSVDYDRAIAADYGQFPAPGPPPPPPDPYAFIPHGPFQDGSRLVDEYWTVRHWDQDRCQNPVRRHQCVVGRDHLIFTRGRISWLAHHRWGSPAHPNWAPNHGGQRWRAENLRINATSPTQAGQWS